MKANNLQLLTNTWSNMTIWKDNLKNYLKLKICIHNLHKSLEIPIAILKLAKHVTLLIIFYQSLYYQLVTDI